MRWSIYVSISLVMTGVALCCCSIYPVVSPVLLIQILLRYDAASSPSVRVSYYCPSREFRAFFLSSLPHVGCRLLIHSHVGNLPIWCISLVRLIIFGPMFSLLCLVSFSENSSCPPVTSPTKASCPYLRSRCCGLCASWVFCRVDFALLYHGHVSRVFSIYGIDLEHQLPRMNRTLFLIFVINFDLQSGVFC